MTTYPNQNKSGKKRIRRNGEKGKKEKNINKDI
jgi:hypothetical protein